MPIETRDDLLRQMAVLEQRLKEAEAALTAFRRGEVDAVVAPGNLVYSLKGADEAYRIMVESMAEGALSVTPQGLVLFANEQFASLLRIPLARVTGSSFYQFIAADDRPLLSALLNSPNRQKAELRLSLSSTDEHLSVLISATRLQLHGSDCVCLIVTDLSEQKRNLEIVAAERLARSIFDQTAGAILVVEPAGRIIRASRAAEQMVNRTVLLSVFDDVFALFRDSDSLRCRLADIVASLGLAPIVNEEVTFRLRDGRTINALMSANLLKIGDSEAHGCIILLHDISSLKQAQEDTLRLSELRSLALEAGNLGSWKYRFDSGDFFGDERCLSMFGVDPNSHPEREIPIARIHPNDREATRAALHRAIAGENGGIYDTQFRVVWPDGSVHWLASHGRAYFETHAALQPEVRFVGVNYEITESKLAEQRLERSLAEKVSLLEEIHHRVKNNLQIVCSLLAMQAHCISNPEIAAKLDDCKNRIGAMARIHQQLYSNENMSSVDLAAYAQDLSAQLIQTYSSSSSITCRVEAASVPVPIEQAVPCGLILNELITNAVKYAYPAGAGEILIAIQSENHWVTMAVSDNGVGLPPHFAGASQSSLGMTLVHALTDQLEGTLAIAPPPGASFTIRFLRRTAPPFSSAASA